MPHIYSNTGYNKDNLSYPSSPDRKKYLDVDYLPRYLVKADLSSKIEDVFQ